MALLNILKREISTLKNDRYMLFVIFILPFVFVTLVTLTFIFGVARDLPIAILDQDNTVLSRMFVRSLDAAPAVKTEYKVSHIKEGEDLLKSLKVYAFIIIPENFQKDIYLQKQPKLIYYYNNQTIAVGGLLTRDIKTTVQSSMVGISADILKKKGLPDKVVLDKTNLIKIDERIKSNPYFNYSYFLMYSLIAHIFQVFVTLTAIWMIGREFKYGTAKQWLHIANNNILIAVSGKMLLYFFIFLTFMAGTYFIYIYGFGAPFAGNLYFTILGLMLFILAYQMMGILFVAVLHNYRQAMSVGGIYTSLGFTLAGMTFPAFAMPLFVRIYSALLPIRPFVALMVDQALKGVPIIFDLSYIYWLLSFIVAGLSSFLFLKKCAEDKRLCFAD